MTWAVLALLSSCAAGTHSSAPPLLGGLTPGRYAVAFDVVARRDGHRTGRPMQIALWLPAARAGQAPPRTYADYFALSLAERDLRPVPEAARARAEAEWRAFLLERGVPEEVSRRWLTAPMLSRPDATASGSRFPLVLVAQGNGQSAVDQAVLAEILASHGYAVASCPSPMNVSGPMKDASEIAARAEEQAADLAFVLHELRREPAVDARRIALVAHSFGSRGALLFAMQHEAVRALVSLDGGIGTALGSDAMRASKLFSSRGLEARVLHAYEELDDFMKPDFGLLREVAGQKLELLPTRGLHHIHFTSLGFAASAFPDVGRATGAGRELKDSLAAILARTLAVLEQALTSSARR